MISQNLISDEQFNALSMESQNLFIRMLVVSDDCGVVPASEYTLNALVNPPKKVKRSIRKYLDEIVSQGLGRIIEHGSKQYFFFKAESFKRFQSYIINKRQKSEYLKMSAEEFDLTNWGNGHDRRS